MICSLALGTFHAGVIITSANSKDGCPYGGPKMVAPWGISIFLIEPSSSKVFLYRPNKSDVIYHSITCSCSLLSLPISERVVALNET